jgi:hypothetical protein
LLFCGGVSVFVGRWMSLSLCGQMEGEFEFFLKLRLQS